MRIAFITSGSYREHEDYLNGDLLGSEYQIFHLSRCLVKKGHDVSIIRRWSESNVETIHNIRIISIKSYDPGDKRIFKALSKLLFSLNVKDRLRDDIYDVLVIIDPFTSFFVNKARVPKVLVTHLMIPYDMLPINMLSMKWSDLLLLKLNKFFQKIIFSNSDVIVALNVSIMDHLIELGHRALMIPNGLELERYVPGDFDGKYILYSGRLVDQKGVKYLLNAYSQLDLDLMREYRLVIVGFGPEEAALKKTALDLDIGDHVEFLPRLSSGEFMDMVSHCSVFVLPSHFECMPVTILEAMALGKAVIASDIPGPKDMIDDGFSGILFMPGDAEDLARKLDLLLHSHDLRESIGYNARKCIEDCYSFNKVADEYIDLFNMLSK